MGETIGTNMKIPKVIHYCWFGGNPIPDSVKKCISSWKKYCPDYKIIEWNESNYNTDNVYAKEALNHKKWAFYSDYARLDIVYQNGGIYLDTDVELIKSLDEVLNDECFLGVETTGFIATGLGFGAVKKNKNIKAMLDEYEGLHFAYKDGTFDTLPCPMRNTQPFIQYGFKKNSREIQILNGAVIYPAEFFCPLDYETNTLEITAKTISIHQYHSSWVSTKDVKYHKLEQKLIQKCGLKTGHRLARIVSFPYRVEKKIKEQGIKNAFICTIKRLNKK